MSVFKLSEKKIVKHEATIDRAKFLQMLRELGHPVPDDTKVTIRVPGGGDYSNMTLDIDDMPIQVEYTTVE